MMLASVAALALAGASGACGPSSRAHIVQPRDNEQFRHVDLESTWAHFACDSGRFDAILLAWPLPGARTGTLRHYELYLRHVPGVGIFNTEAEAEATAVLAGFLIHRAGHERYTTGVVRGMLSIDGDDWQRSGQLSLDFADGATLVGSFRAVRSDVTLEFFEHDHAADLANLGQAWRNPPANASGG